MFDLLFMKSVVICIGYKLASQFLNDMLYVVFFTGYNPEKAMK